MSIESYADLKDRMAKYLKRQDLVDLIPDFIMLAEEQFDNTIFTRARRESFIITPYSYTVALPSGWRRVIDAFYNGTQLQYRGPGNDSAYAGATFPAAYGMYQIIGNSFIFSGSTAQLGAKLQIDYYDALEPLSDSNVSNWLLEDSPTTYLFGSLAQAAMYIRDTERLQLWQALANQASDAMVTRDKLGDTPENGPLQIISG